MGKSLRFLPLRSNLCLISTSPVDSLCAEPLRFSPLLFFMSNPNYAAEKRKVMDGGSSSSDPLGDFPPLGSDGGAASKSASVGGAPPVRAEPGA